MFSICEAVCEDMLESKDISELFIGIGTLYIKNVDGNIKYHFEPCDSLDKALMQTYLNKMNPIDSMLNDSLHKKFTEIYKDLC